MPAIAIIGGQWGDEGKGKIVDMLAEKADMVVRYSGGSNAGHTVINHYGEFKLHLIPSGIFYPKVTCVIANGVVVEPDVLLKEIADLESRKVDTNHLCISDRAHLVMPYHIALDGLEEDARGSGAIGTTRRGIGPVFADKIARQGIRCGDLLDKKSLLVLLRNELERKNTLLTKVYGAKPYSLDEMYQQCCQWGERISPYIKQTELVIGKALDKGATVLLEGAQGTLLDPDFGSYPYVTSSSPISGGACVGSGISPNKLKRILGVFKAYTTRVGGGPHPTELKDETGNLIRERAREYGATTGRPRRCGWFDAVAGRFSVRLNGITGIVITRLDVLDVLPQIKICTGYRLDGKTIDYFPSSTAALGRCQPIYEDMEGWSTPINEARSFKDLPMAARRYIKRLEELLDCPVDIISVGARREQTVIRKAL
jgi:adenylosuccinate synthase